MYTVGIGIGDYQKKVSVLVRGPLKMVAVPPYIK